MSVSLAKSKPLWRITGSRVIGARPKLVQRQFQRGLRTTNSERATETVTPSNVDPFRDVPSQSPMSCSRDPC